MPYIDTNRRIELLNKDFPKTPGELNYMFSILSWNYYKAHPNYQGINDIVGALEGAKLETYRKVAAPYENQKANMNGEVFV